jgi:hypothetical protein
MSPPYASIALVGSDADRQTIVCVIARRTYSFDDAGRVVVSAEQTGLAVAMEQSDGSPFPQLVADTDLYPVKPCTDVVVLGSVHAPRGQAVTRMRAAIAVGPREKAVEVIGDRRAERSPAGLSFTAPEPFTSMPLTYARAYGGVDRGVPLPPVRTLDDLVDLLGREVTRTHPGMYPRNPGGTGYVVMEASAEGLILPNFEDPSRLLTPESLVVRSRADWWRMPIPQGFGWRSTAHYPRCLFLGSVPELPPPDDTDQVEEVRLGLVPRGESRRAAERGLPDAIDLRMANGASAGLILPHLEGNERVKLTGFSPAGDIVFTLPAERPRVSIADAGGPLQVTTVLHTLLIEPERGRFSLVWGARAPAGPGFPVRLPRRGEAEWDPLEGVVITVDGVRLDGAAPRRE